MRKAISVLKKRTGAHEDLIREFKIRGDRLEVGAPLSELRGVLTGVPEYTGAGDGLIGVVSDAVGAPCGRADGRLDTGWPPTRR